MKSLNRVLADYCRMMVTVFVVIFSTLSAPLIHAACDDGLRQKDQAQRFAVVNDGAVVQDRWTGLYWSRCLLGETWNPMLAQCEGSASISSWVQAQMATIAATWAEKDGWRVPNVKELESLVDRACSTPSIHDVAFSGQSAAVSNPQWTSSPVENYGQGAWTVNFKNGSVIPAEKSTEYVSRMVRDTY